MHGSILLYLLPPAPWDKSSPSVLGWGIFFKQPSPVRREQGKQKVNSCCSFEVCHFSVRVCNMMASDQEEEDL